MSTELSVISHFTDSIFTTFIYSIIAFFFLCLSASYFDKMKNFSKNIELLKKRDSIRDKEFGDLVSRYEKQQIRNETKFENITEIQQILESKLKTLKKEIESIRETLESDYDELMEFISKQEKQQSKSEVRFDKVEKILEKIQEVSKNELIVLQEKQQIKNELRFTKVEKILENVNGKKIITTGGQLFNPEKFHLSGRPSSETQGLISFHSITKVAKVKINYTYGDSCGRYFAWNRSNSDGYRIHFPQESDSSELFWTLFLHKPSRRVLIGVGDGNENQFICDILYGEGHGPWAKVAIKSGVDDENTFWIIESLPSNNWVFRTSFKRKLTNDGLNIIVAETNKALVWSDFS
jgi:uncharacterized protein YqgV (UPF0045/DUF77 family)